MYGHQYLTYLPWKFLSKLFFWQKYGSKMPYLPTVWTYVQTFVVFSGPFPLLWGLEGDVVWLIIDTVCSAKLELDLAWQYPDKNINNYRATNNIFYLCVCVGSHVRILYHCKQYPILLITIEQQILFILFYLFVCMCGFAFHVWKLCTEP